MEPSCQPERRFGKCRERWKRVKVIFHFQFAPLLLLRTKHLPSQSLAIPTDHSSGCNSMATKDLLSKSAL